MKRILHLGFLMAVLMGNGFVSADASRVVSIEGVKNTRDLGGLTTSDGRTIQAGLLIRSGEIDHITESGKADLNAMGVAAVIDLRTTSEASAGPAEWSEGTGPERFNFPLLENETDRIIEMRRMIKSGTAESEWMDNAFRDSFGSIPIEDSASIRKVFDLLLELPDGKPLLFHCSGGKDRTGVVSAMVLTSLGVPREQIEADFMMSNVLIQPDKTAVEMANKINAANGTDMPAEALWPSLGVKREYLDYFYSTVESKYGSVEDYLEKELGLSQVQIESLRTKYLK